MPHIPLGHQAHCIRCDARIATSATHGRAKQRTAAAAIAALILFFPAMTLPLIEIERLGHRHASNLLFGTWEMLTHGAWFIGSIVLLFSIVLPLVKIVLLLELSILCLTRQKHRGWTYRLMEHVGKWGMMDVLLLALMVMLVKLGSMVEVHLGPGILAFALCVMMSMIASINFDPHSIWNER